jgi:hypothetical protein
LGAVHGNWFLQGDGVMSDAGTEPSDGLDEFLPDIWFADHPEARRKKEPLDSPWWKV